ncbi:MAG: cell division protein ZapE [Rhodanobacteraceae bacterium]
MDSGVIICADDLPTARYAQGLAVHQWQDDPAQHAALTAFDRLHHELTCRPGGFWRNFADAFSDRRAPRGIYLHGAVGRGKTMLMDLFVESLPRGMAQRRHFHRFMLDVHARLRRSLDRRDPLREVAAHIARHSRVLCLDEFQVTDIGDAMILDGLLRGLFAHGAALVATSNTAPQNLYRDGLQRARFLPAIDAIERHCHVLELASPHDWRLRALTRAPVYLSPLGADAERGLSRLFAELAQGRVQQGGELIVNDRAIPVRRACAQAAWFDFEALCEGPRGAADYIELARAYPAILVSRVPQFTPGSDNAALRFVRMVDEFYDRRVKLVLSAAVPAVELYDGKRLRAEFARTESRLIEMQSTAYLAQAHR